MTLRCTRKERRKRGFVLRTSSRRYWNGETSLEVSYNKWFTRSPARALLFPDRRSAYEAAGGHEYLQHAVPEEFWG